MITVEETDETERRSGTGGIVISPDARPPSTVQKRSLRLNFGWTLVGNTLYLATQWGILVLLARVGDAKAVGQFSLGLAITAPIMLFASLSLRAVQATDPRITFEFRDYAGLRILTAVVAALVIFGIAGVTYRGETALAIAAFALSKGVESLSDVVYGLWQQQERMDLIAKSLVLRGLFGLVAAAFCFTIFRTVWTAVCGMAGAWTIVLAGFDLRHAAIVATGLQQSVRPRFSAAKMRRLARLCMPLGIVGMLISFDVNVPRYMISHIQGVADLGIFSALGYVLMGGTMVVGALGQSSIPRLAHYASYGNTRDFRKLLGRLCFAGMTLGICAVLAVIAFGESLIALVYGGEYAAHHRLLVWLTVAAAIGYVTSFGGCGLTAARYFRVQIPLFVSITVLTVVLCYVMVKGDGAVGAAKALSVVGSVQLIATIALLHHLQSRGAARL